jgi:hypothetical protein
MEVVEQNELLGQRVVVRRHLAPVHQQRRIPPPALDVREHLVVRPVLFDQQEDVLDAQLRNILHPARRLEPRARRRRHLALAGLQFGRRRVGVAVEHAFIDAAVVPARRALIVARPLHARHHQPPVRRRVQTRREPPHRRPPRQLPRLARQVEDGDRILAAAGHIQPLAVGPERHAVRNRAHRRLRRHCQRLRTPRRRIEQLHRIGMAVGHRQRLAVFGQRHARRGQARSLRLHTRVFQVDHAQAPGQHRSRGIHRQVLLAARRHRRRGLAFTRAIGNIQPPGGLIQHHRKRSQPDRNAPDDLAFAGIDLHHFVVVMHRRIQPRAVFRKRHPAGIGWPGRFIRVVPVSLPSGVYSAINRLSGPDLVASLAHTSLVPGRKAMPI